MPPPLLWGVRLNDSGAMHQQDIRVGGIQLPRGRAPVLVLLDGHLHGHSGAVQRMGRGVFAVAVSGRVWQALPKVVHNPPRVTHGGRSCLLAVVALDGALEEHGVVFECGVLHPHGCALGERHDAARFAVCVSFGENSLKNLAFLNLNLRRL